MPFPTSIVNVAGALFSQSITVYEGTETRLANGEVINERSPDRIITGVIQPHAELDILVAAEGAKSLKGFLILHTTFELFAYDSTALGVIKTQTYVIYEANVWKVSMREDWRDKTAGYNQYIIRKYQNIGTV